MKYKYYDIILRDEDLHEDWTDELTTSGLRGYISPLHRYSDIKPHYHVLLSFRLPVSSEYVFNFFDGLALSAFIRPVKSIRGSKALLLDPFHYPGRSVDNIVCFGGADLNKII